MNVGRVVIGFLIMMSVIVALSVVNDAVCARASSDGFRSSCSAALSICALCASCAYLGVEYSLASEAGGGYSLYERRQQEAASDRAARATLDAQDNPGGMAGPRVDPDDYSR